MAIEDAVALARLLAESRDVDQVLRAYDRLIEDPYTRDPAPPELPVIPGPHRIG